MRKIGTLNPAATLAALTPVAGQATTGGTTDLSYGHEQPREEDNSFPWDCSGF